jgi:DNA polymerase elongation subunit (family B)
MILDIAQNRSQLDISYLNKDGNKAVMQIPVPQFTNWVIDYNGNGTPGYIDISGKPVVKRWAKRFRTFDLLEFLHSLPKDKQDELFAYREANLVAFDIETQIGDSFPVPELAEMPINCISNVDTHMNIVVYTTKEVAGDITVEDVVEAEPTDDGAFMEVIQCAVIDIAAKNPKKYEQLLSEGHADGEMVDYETGRWLKLVKRQTTLPDEVNKITREQIGHLVAPHEQINVQLLHFDTEKQMLEAWLSTVVKFGAVLSGWNIDGFDNMYICNRCKQLGIPMELGSITGQISTMTGMPKHTIFVDYMAMIEKYDRRIQNRESSRLDYISFRLLGKGKLSYRGSLKDLEENDVPGFLAYNAIDSILVQLIHRNLNLMATLYGFSHVCYIPLAKANSQVAQTEALISLDTLNWLDTEGIDMPPKPDDGYYHVAAYDERKPPRRKYDGGHVKEPHKHVASWNACIDYSGLYPSCQRSLNMSVENYIGPLSRFTPAQQRAILNDKNYLVSVNKNVYKNDRAYAYKRIQIFLRAKRDYHKARMNKHLALMQPFIEKALHERGVWQENPVVDETVKELFWTVTIDGKDYTPNLVDLNEPGTEYDTPEDAANHTNGHENHVNFLWFLFHENLRQGFFEMNMQVSYKLVANSLYGATANEGNSFRNVDVADDTTAEGRNSIITGEMLINNWFNFEWAHDYAAHKFLLNAFPGQFTKLVEGDMPPLPIKDRVMYIDTDSLYIEYIDLMENCGYTGSEIDFMVALYNGYKRKNPDGTKTKVKGYLGELIEGRLHDMVNGRHGASMQKFDLEHIARVGLFRKKKSYLKTSDWVDGRTYTYDDAFKHLKCTGFALARTFQSVRARETCRKAIVEILQGKWKTKADYLRNLMLIWQDFQTWSIDDISKRMSIRKHIYDKQIPKLLPYPDFQKRTLPQYRGAGWHNWQLIQRGLQDQVEPIKDGFVCFYEDIYGNFFSYRLNDCPSWAPEPNKVMQFYKLVADVIRDVACYYDIVCPLNIGEEPAPNSEDSEEDQ